jgi:hypothetical protein
MRRHLGVLALLAAAVAMGCDGRFSRSVFAAPNGVPHNVSASPTAAGIELRWDPVATATSYRVYASDSPAVVLGSANRLEVIGSSYLDDTVAPGATRYYAVTAVGPSGESAASAPVSATAPFTTVVSALYQTNGSGWNDYVANDGTTVFVARDAPCTSTGGGYATCLHGGEMRQALVPGQDSCDGIVAADELGALQWTCVGDPGGGAPRVVSTGLTEGKFLSDLLDFDAVAFRPLSLSVRRRGVLVAVAARSIWWSNPVAVASGGTLASPGTVYVVTSSASAAHVLGANRIALVVRPGATVSAPASNAAVSGVSPRYAWVEGTFDASAGLEGIYVYGAQFVVVRGARIKGADAGTRYGLLLSGTNSKISDVRVAGGSGTMIGVGVTYSSDVTLARILVAQGGGIFVASSSRVSGSSLTGFAGGSTYSREGIQLADTQFSALIGATCATGSEGIGLVSASDNTLASVASIGNAYSGVALWTGTSGVGSDRNQFADLAVLDDGGATLDFTGASDNRVTGQLLVGRDPRCQVNGGTSPGVISGTCTDTGLDGSSTYSGQASDAILLRGRTATGAFVGRVTVDDAVNASDVYGSASFTQITDWLGFASPLRGWARDGTPFLASTAGACEGSDLCRIWDWELRASDAVLRGTIDPRLLTHVWATSSSPYSQAECDTLHRGSVASGNACVSTFLAGAIELEGDGVGNDDGLCDSGERCVLAPNIGSYQGRGDLLDAGAVIIGDFSARVFSRAVNGR